jgi:CubicO group peptidase (beta-lactamase class C family)
MAKHDIQNRNRIDPSTANDTVAGARRLYSGKVFPGKVVSTLRNGEQLFPTRTVARGKTVSPLEQSDVPLPDVHFESKEADYDLFDYMSRNRVAGLLILKDSRVVLEKYEFSNTDKSRWLSMSMAKSISSALVGIAIKSSLIGDIDDRLTLYLPEFEGSGYDRVTIRQLLQMTSGVRWDESYLDPNSDRRRMLDLQIDQEPGAILRYMSRLPSIAPPGTVWNYSTGETHIVGALLRACTGMPVAQFLSENIWSRIGMEADATWWLESPEGLEVAGSGISASLRDYGRFGLFIMNDGIIEGEQMLPQGWVRESGAPMEIGGERVNYGFMWWPVPEDSREVGAFGARGIFGQHIYINPNERIVIVVWSARSKPKDADVVTDNDFFNAVVRALR